MQTVRIAKDPAPVTGMAVVVTAIVMLVLVIGTAIYHDRAQDLRGCVADKGLTSDLSYADLEYECKNGG